jgi:hypothetical protein|eukprot:SAG25_NODE_580_length_6767_cov_20.692412_8_plen_102_part_00
MGGVGVGLVRSLITSHPVVTTIACPVSSRVSQARVQRIQTAMAELDEISQQAEDAQPPEVGFTLDGACAKRDKPCCPRCSASASSWPRFPQGAHALPAMTA